MVKGMFISPINKLATIKNDHQRSDNKNNMRKIGLIILLGLISKSVYCQKFETNLTISPLMTLKSNETTESKIAFGFSNSIQEFYNLTDNFAIGSEIRYSFENYKLTRDFDGISIPEATSYYESKLTLHSLNIPLILRLKTKSDWSLNIGYGLTYNLDYKASVDYIYSDWFSKDDTRTEIPEKSVDLENDLSSYFSIGLGKAFKIKDLRVLTEIYYNHSFADYRIEHGGANGAEILYFYDISPRYIGFKIGFGL